MTARKLDLSPYALPHVHVDNGQPAMYDVRGSLVNLCFVPELELTGPRVLFAGKVSEAIENCQEPAVLLDQSQWSLLNQACILHKGFGRNDVELVRRITEAETVDVSEK